MWARICKKGHDVSIYIKHVKVKHCIMELTSYIGEVFLDLNL
jgi:hypothetical protein